MLGALSSDLSSDLSSELSSKSSFWLLGDAWRWIFLELEVDSRGTPDEFKMENLKTQWVRDELYGSPQWGVRSESKMRFEVIPQWARNRWWLEIGDEQASQSIQHFTAVRLSLAVLRTAKILKTHKLEKMRRCGELFCSFSLGEFDSVRLDLTKFVHVERLAAVVSANSARDCKGASTKNLG